jgi:type I restriction enzyme, S subunit
MVAWETQPIGEIASVNYGYTAKASFEIEGPNFLRITDIQNEAVDWGKVPSCEISDDDYTKHKLLDGDIVFARTGATTGKSYLLNDPPTSIAASYLIRLRINTPNVFPGFVAKFFLTREYWDEVEKGLSGAAQGGFNATKLSSLTIPLPPLPEQNRIVAILDEAFAGIDAAVANAEMNLANARELFESYLNGIFSRDGDGWLSKPLGECFRLRSGDGLTSKEMIEGDFPVFGGNGIAGTHNNHNLAGDNVIIGRVGALCGNARHIKETIWLTDNAFKVVDKKHDIDNAFLAYLLNFNNLRGLARQSAQPVISNSSLKDLVLNFPKAETEQRQIVEQLDAITYQRERLEAIYQQKLDALAELKQSILQKAFSGELTQQEAAA